jgi:hypothetical protein
MIMASRLSPPVDRFPQSEKAAKASKATHLYMYKKQMIRARRLIDRSDQ